MNMPREVDTSAMTPIEFQAWVLDDMADEDALPCRNPHAFGVVCDDQVGP